MCTQPLSVHVLEGAHEPHLCEHSQFSNFPTNQKLTLSLSHPYSVHSCAHLFFMHVVNTLCVCSMEFVPRYIKTSGNATVDHLSKYLAVRLALEELRRNTEASPVNVEAASEKQYTIYIPTAGNQFTVSIRAHISHTDS